jgi:hypothetical protein
VTEAIKTFQVILPSGVVLTAWDTTLEEMQGRFPEAEVTEKAKAAPEAVPGGEP